jgi:hypothetical protein
MIDYFANGNACPAQYKTAASVAAANGNGELQPMTFSAGEANALTAVGITQVQAMVTTTPSLLNGFDPTFNNYAGGLMPNFVRSTLRAVPATRPVPFFRASKNLGGTDSLVCAGTGRASQRVPDWRSNPSHDFAEKSRKSC